MLADPIVIVGAGQAGGRAALCLRELGHDGPVILLGAEAEAPYERPPLSKTYLQGTRSLAEATFASAETLAAAGIEFRPATRVLAIDRAGRRLRLKGGGDLPYGRLLLATGRRPRCLPGLDGASERVHVLRDVADADRLRQALGPGRHLAIVGGGFIGLEVAATAVGLGTQVTVVEAAARLLSRAVPVGIAAVLLARHVEAGVTLLVGRRLQGIAVAPSGVALEMEDGSRIDADAVLIGIGAEPRIELAVEAGLAVDAGILVDATLATSDPRIYAAGDVCAFPHPLATGLLRLEAWRNADAQGALAARNLLGAGQPHAELPWFWSDQYELTLQIAGFPEQATASVERRVGSDGKLLFHLDEAGRVAGVSGIGPASLARDFKLAQLMCERRLAASPTTLADPDVRLKSLLS